MNRKTLFSLGLLLLFAACKPCNDPTNPDCDNYCDDPANPECFNYDPCLGKNEVSAAFTIEEVLYEHRDSLHYIPTDTTVAGPNFVVFKAVHEADSYTWRIGNDSRVWNTRSVTLRFQDPTELLVALAVSSTPDSNCFPFDNGLDTVVRRLVVVERPQTAMKGRFHMTVVQLPKFSLPLFPHPWDTFELRLTEFTHNETALYPEYGYRIQNFPPGCLNDRFRSFWGEEIAYRAMTFHHDSKESNECDFGPHGIIRLVGADSVEIRSTLYDKRGPLDPNRPWFPAFEGRLIARGVRIE